MFGDLNIIRFILLILVFVVFWVLILHNLIGGCQHN